MIDLFVNQLTVIDFSYLCPDRGLLGESWWTDLTLEGVLDDQSMVLDFGLVKKQIKSAIDELADHRLIVPANYEQQSVTGDTEKTFLSWTSTDGSQIQMQSPADALLLIDSDRVTEQALQNYLEVAIKPRLPANVRGIKLHIYPEKIDSDFYHYSHGLKKHDGNCQRIAHGHRSKIEIFIDGLRDQQREAQWAATFRDIYIATAEDFLQVETISGIEHNRYRYQAPQGQFELCVPAKTCYSIKTDSTVEQIAQHVADTIASKISEKVLVKAYEGINKGAIAHAN